jgi:hypothetical protein
VPKLKSRAEDPGLGAEGCTLDSGMFLRDNHRPAQLWFEAFISLKFSTLPQNANVHTFVSKCAKVFKTLPKWRSIGSKIYRFLQPAEKVIFWILYCK